MNMTTDKEVKMALEVYQVHLLSDAIQASGRLNEENTRFLCSLACNPISCDREK